MRGIICATPWEMKAVLGALPGLREAEAPGGMRARRGKRGVSEVVVLCAGVGKVAAAAGAMFLLERHGAEELLVLGVAGALHEELRLGDLVLADEAVPADTGIAHSGGFHTTGPGMGEGERLVFHPAFSASPELLLRARSAAASASLPHRVGRVLTCDQVVLDPALRLHLEERFGALAVEMEGAAVAQVAACAGIPFLAVRGISDEVSHDFAGLERALEYRGQSRRNLWAERFRLTVEDPAAVERARELARGRDLALERLEKFLRAFLEND
ncbi:MAG: futalosine hydrolase [Actinomycetota bacterium]|nr:futalosine hydrolase [Actinomycetota bacterium]